MKNSQNNKYIKIIKTRKYKNINLYLRFTIPNSSNLKAKLSILTKLMGEASLKYPDLNSMLKARDMLYGISLTPSYKCRNNSIVFTLHYSFINPKFLKVSIDDYNEYILETLNNTLINTKVVDQAKRTIKASLLRNNDKPNVKAKQRFIDIVSKDNPDFNIYSENIKFINSISKVSVKQVKDIYEYIKNKAQLHLYLCGDLTQKQIDVLSNYSFNDRDAYVDKYVSFEYKPKKDIVEHVDASQSYLSIVYSTPFNKLHKDYFAWFLGNVFFGMFPTSLLFSSVREKLSLCYAISAVDYKNEGLVKITTSIDGKNANKVIEEVNKQLQKLIECDYDFKQLEITKKLLINSLNSTYDDIDVLVDYYNEGTLSNFNYSIEEYIRRIEKVTPKDISRVFKQYKHYFNYLLLGDTND